MSGQERTRGEDCRGPGRHGWLFVQPVMAGDAAARRDAVGAGAAWDPPSAPRGMSEVPGPCPHCGRPEVRAEPRGTRLVCTGCNRLVTAAGVLAPYRRGPEATRGALAAAGPRRATWAETFTRGT